MTFQQKLWHGRGQSDASRKVKVWYWTAWKVKNDAFAWYCAGYYSQLGNPS